MTVQIGTVAQIAIAVALFIAIFHGWG